ncbi:MAG: site-specific DNA-methyltransferase [Verrucomicrobia bacterium]|nr:site-specific DNA-methyltransferase [Verrucomicrobiota bacterium]
MNGFSPAPRDQRLSALKSLIPEAFSEGKIDWEKLKAALGEDVNFSNERYVLNWAGKSEAFRILQEPSSATLVPVREESVDFDNTQNIFIEGENLAVLKALQKSYFNKVKMIYIDPPYNTGNDSFIYPDKFSETKEEYLKRVGDKDESGYMLREGRFAKNSKENGQYHSNWLNMMMPRLYLAKNLLREDGVIFVSIDDNEVHNLRLLMNEIFGEENFVAQIPWQSRASIQNDTDFSVNHEYVIAYAKHRRQENRRLKESNAEEWYKTNSFVCKPLPLDKDKFDNPDNDSRGLWKADPFDAPNVRSNLTYPIVNPTTGETYFPARGRHWRTDLKQYKKALADNRICFGKDGKGKPQLKVFYEEKKAYGSIDNSWFDANRIGTSTLGTKELQRLFDGVANFDTPKPTTLLKKLLDLSNLQKDSIILDFFAGSGTTAHAVMQLNREDGGNRKYICVQLPEKCDEKTEAFKAGYKTIADIAKERIRRAGTKIRGEVEAEQAKQSGELGLAGTPEVKMPDLGFKVFRLEDSNFKQWRKTTAATLAEVEQQMLDLVDPVKPDAAVENIIYELLLKSGKDLNSKIVRGNGFYNVNDGELVLLLESASQEIVDSVIALAPAKVIALDRLFHGNDQLKTNTSLQFRDSSVEFLTI